jgi:hypothetical protein
MQEQFKPRSHVTMGASHIIGGRDTLAEDKLYKAEYVGSGTFIISKPKRNKMKRRQDKLKNPKRGSRK